MTVLGYLANGLVFSSIIVLGSIGLSLVYSIADFANFAHGDTMTIGAYTALVTFGAVGGLGGAVLGLPYGFFLALVVGIASRRSSRSAPRNSSTNRSTSIRSAC